MVGRFCADDVLGVALGRFLDDQAEPDPEPEDAVQTAPATIGGFPWPGRYIGATFGAWDAEEVAVGFREDGEPLGDVGAADDWDAVTATLTPSQIGAEILWGEVGQPGDVEEVTDALTVERVMGAGPDELGDGATGATITLGSAVTLAWVGTVAEAESGSFAALLAAFVETTGSVRRGVALGVSSTGLAQCVVLNGTALSQAAAEALVTGGVAAVQALLESGPSWAPSESMSDGDTTTDGGDIDGDTWTLNADIEIGGLNVAA